MAELVFITSRFPYPLDKGDKLRVYFQIQELANYHDVHLIALSDHPVTDEDYRTLSNLCASVHICKLNPIRKVVQLIFSCFRGTPLQVAYFYDPKIKKQIHEIINRLSPGHIHCHLIRAAEYVKEITTCPKSLDFMDAFAKGMENRELIERNPLKKILFRYEKKRLSSYEEKVFDYFDRYCIISEQDKKCIQSGRSGELRIVPNGVDTKSFFPRDDEKIYDLIFMGNLDYPPNVISVHFIIDNILPILKVHKPDIRLLIAGRGASDNMLRKQNSNIIFRSDFKHISESISCSKIMLGPLLIHIGMPNKILQAMAMKVPCIVSTSCKNSIAPGHENYLIEANTADEYVNEVLKLLYNPDLTTEIANGAFHFVMKNYSWKEQGLKLHKLISTSF